MKTHEETIKKLIELEEQLGLYRYKIGKIPVWNIIRYKIRRQYLYRETGINEKETVKCTINIKGLIKYTWLSLKQFTQLIIKKREIDNLMMGFSRLEKVGDVYVDKFIDPIINQSNLQNNYIYIEYGKTGCHKTPRINQNNILYLDFFYLSFYTLGIIISPFILLMKYRTLTEFYKKLKKEIIKNERQFRFILFTLGEAFLQYHFFKFMLKKNTRKTNFWSQPDIVFYAVIGSQRHEFTCL